jgi:hypothetical protein
VFETAESFYRTLPGASPAERATVLHGRPQDVAAMVAAGRKKPSQALATRARVEHSRWLVDCPDPTCAGCQYASKDDPRFFCNYCHNAAAGGWVTVVWPDDLDEIESTLAARPDPRTRNWSPGETAADLARENEAQGVGV